MENNEISFSWLIKQRIYNCNFRLTYGYKLVDVMSYEKLVHV